VGTPCSGQSEHRVRARVGKDEKVGAAATTQAERVTRDARSLPRSLRQPAGGAHVANRARMANGSGMANRARMAQGRTQSLAWLNPRTFAQYS